ncbi:MAG: ATP-binding protein [Actinomycetota bacterium]
MRRRIVLSTLAVAVAVALVFGLPLAVIGSRYLAAQHQDRVRLDAERALRLAEIRVEASQPLDATALAPVLGAVQYLQVEVPGHPALQVGRDPRPGPVIAATVVGDFGVKVVAVEPRARLEADLARLEGLVLGVGLLAVGVAGALAWWQARRLSDPLEDLARTAERLGSGDPRPQHHRYGVAELDRVAEVLDASAEQVAANLAAERQFATDASHQLRTPLTALSMRLEEILGTDDPAAVRDEATVALTQVERLTDVVDRLLAHTRRTRAGTAVPVDVDRVVRQQAAEWAAPFGKVGRRLEVDGTPGLRALASPGGLAQVLATLLENSLVHGAGTVRLHTRRTGGSVVIEVADEGPGVPVELGARVFERAVSGGEGSGVGLAVARDLAEADGGRLELLTHRPPVFAVFLAAADPG